MDDFSRIELAMISQIRRAEKQLPEEIWGVEAVQELACLLAKIEPLLTDEQMAILIGCGAIMCRQANQEMKAGLEAAIALSKAQRR